MAFEGVLIFLAVLNVYLLVVYVLKKRGLLEKYGLSLFGPALMMRTKRGRKLIDRIARPKELWKRYGDVTIWTVVIAGVLMMVLLAVGVVFSFQVQEGEQVGPAELLAIPGLNPFIPLGYGIMALAIAIVIHEFAHGILARAHDLKVKSLGLLLFIVPIGAFMEPDEEELLGSHPRTKTRVFAAGAGTSILISFVFAGVFSWGLVPMAQPASPGLGVVQTFDETPAEEINLRPGMILVSVDGTAIEDTDAFLRVFNRTEPGDRVSLEVHTGGETHQRSVELIGRYDYLRDRCRDRGLSPGECEDRLREDYVSRCQAREGASRSTCSARWNQTDPEEGFLGASVVEPERILGLLQPGTDLRDTFAYLFLPVIGFSPINSPIANFFEIQGPLAGLGLAGFWTLANSMYWLFWINFLLGTFNALPLTVLDGGHVFKEGVRKLLRMPSSPPDPEVVEARVDQATRVMTVVVVGAIAAQVLIPWVINAI